MKPKDHVIAATDDIAEVLKILARINFLNENQACGNILTAARKLQESSEHLQEAVKKMLGVEKN